MINALRAIFCKPTAAAIRQSQIDDAQRTILADLAAAENYEAQAKSHRARAAIYQQRIKRLEKSK